MSLFEKNRLQKLSALLQLLNAAQVSGKDSLRLILEMLEEVDQALGEEQTKMQSKLASG